MWRCRGVRAGAAGTQARDGSRRFVHVSLWSQSVHGPHLSNHSCSLGYLIEVVFMPRKKAAVKLSVHILLRTL